MELTAIVHNLLFTVPKRETSAMKVVRSSLGRPEAEEQRPIYRKGFPGKKSMRAEVFMTFSKSVI